MKEHFIHEFSYSDTFRDNKNNRIAFLDYIYSNLFFDNHHTSTLYHARFLKEKKLKILSLKDKTVLYKNMLQSHAL